MDNKVKFWHKLYSKLPVVMFDVLTIPVAWYMAYWLRYNMNPFPTNLTTIYSLTALIILACIQTASYHHFKVYRGLWEAYGDSHQSVMLHVLLNQSLP